MTDSLGNGPEAHAAAEAVARSLREREADVRAVSELEAHLREAETLLREAFQSIGDLMDATLLAQGYRRSNYGPWRKKRNG